VSSLIVPLQMFAFCVNLLFNGAMFVRLRRMSAEQKKVAWKHQGLFVYLAFSSSLFGALAFGSRWRHLTLIYSVNALLSTSNPTNDMLQYAYEQYWIYRQLRSGGVLRQSSRFDGRSCGGFFCSHGTCISSLKPGVAAGGGTACHVTAHTS